jgi:hypothetical protein
MAKNKPDIRTNKRINKLLGFIQTGMDDLYNDTYLSSIETKRDLDNIKNNIEDSIDSMLSNTSDSMGIPDITRMYTRMKLKDMQGDSSVNNAVIDLFNDQSLMSSLMTMSTENKYLIEYDREIDTVCRYMPKLEEALDAKKDNVLSADNFSKDFISVKNSTSKNKEATFNKRIEEIKDKYELDTLFEDIYSNASKYGEQFVYIVPYKQALSRLMMQKQGQIAPSLSVMEASFINDNKVSSDINKIDFDRKFNGYYTESKCNINEFKIQLDKRGLLESAVSNLRKAAEIKQKNNISSIYETAIEQYVTEGTKNKLDKTIDEDELEFPNDIDKTSKDGLISSDLKSTKINVPGCVVKKLKRENIIPLYIEDICMGYYYIELENNSFYDYKNINDPSLTMKSPTRNFINGGLEDPKKDNLIRYISGQMSRYIDTNFINANQDLRKEIYMILKHNEIFNIDQCSNQIKVTFIPPEDIVHIKFKTDPHTHRGISDLDKALLPAKLYSCLYITNSIASMTRGQDKRVYYVKQNIETNISRTLLNVIEQIKKNNFGIRQIENINNILNITGRFNDYVIPVGPSGDSPIQFEVMQGQNIDIKTELMNILEELAVNSTDVPLELIQARQSLDYAVQLNMTNSKFLRKVFKRQSIIENFYSRIITRIYNCEYEENETLEMSLPAPAFLMMTNTNQLIDNTVQYINSITDIEMVGESDAVKVIFKKKMLRHHLPSHININLIDTLKSQSRIEAAIDNTDEGE